MWRGESILRWLIERCPECRHTAIGNYDHLAHRDDCSKPKPEFIVERVLNHGEGPPEDGAERERDICPECGAERWQLVIVPERFYCDDCKKAGPGPNGDAPAPKPEQIDLFGEPGAHVMAAEMPDE